MSHMSGLLDDVDPSPTPPSPPSALASPSVAPLPPAPAPSIQAALPLGWPPVPPCPLQLSMSREHRNATVAALAARVLALRQPPPPPAAGTRPPPLPLFNRARSRARLLRYYARPQHMPVLMSRELIFEMEARWPGEFERTRRHTLRLGQEVELNFLYHHYLRAMRFPLVPVSSSRVEFLFAQSCAKPAGAQLCARLLRQRESDFITFNDDATKDQALQLGLLNLHRLLREQFGTFNAAANGTGRASAAGLLAA